MNRAEHDIDLKVFNKFFDDGKKNRIFVDVGAARPDYLSISAFFRDNGWRVIAIEPNPEFAELHRSLGHEVLEYACGTENKDDMEFCVANSHGASYENGNVSYESFSSLSLKSGYRAMLPASVSLNTIKVRVRRLENLLKEHAGINRFDVLSIDVEGWELEVLEGIDLSAFKPSVIIMENFLSDLNYNKKMKSLGYFLWKELFPNQVYVTAGLVEQLPFFERIKVKATNR